MSKQDRQGVRTATDLERKYDFGLLGKTAGGVDDQKLAQLTQTVTQYMTETNNAINGLQEQVETLAPEYIIGDGLKLEEETNTLSVKVGNGLKLDGQNALSIDQEKIDTMSSLDVYPIGSIYMSVNSTDPGMIFGGIWAECHFIVGETIVFYMWERTA